MRRKTLILPLLAISAGAFAATGAAPSARAANGDPIAELPVSFQVVNSNTTSVRCNADGKNYTVHGHIVAPSSALTHPDVATLYLHAVTFGEYYWNLKSIAGYDYAGQEASLGNVSVIVDRLGFGSSDRPPGMDMCFGSVADVAHQIVQDLRGGHYQVESGAVPAFPHVFIGGASVGGMSSMIEDYTFHDVDGVINFAWGDFVAGPFTARVYSDTVRRCLQGGDPGTPGYAAFALNDRDQFYFNSASQDVRTAVPPLHADPCGEILSIPAGIQADQAGEPQIDVPVLVLFGDSDVVFPPPAGRQEAAHLTGSPSVTLEMIPHASHYPLLEASHLQVVKVVDHWLKAHHP
jgi:pimeloyl-ACP methyl ester carboxylesterase